MTKFSFYLFIGRISRIKLVCVPEADKNLQVYNVVSLRKVGMVFFFWGVGSLAGNRAQVMALRVLKPNHYTTGEPPPGMLFYISTQY